jgi:hypothetical protein
MRKFIIVTALAMLCASVNAQEKLKGALDYVTNHFTVNGYAQLGWEYASESDPNNTFKVSRIIVFTDYRIDDRWNAFAMVDFKSFSLHEMWVSFKVAPWMKFKLGQFKTPFSIENPISPAVMEMITQMSLAGSHMVAGASPLMMPGGAGRDIGLTMYGDIGQKVSYDLAVMNGAGRNRLDDNSWKDFVGRLTFHPLKELDLSGSVILGKGSRSTLDTYIGGTGEPKGNYTRNRYSAGFQLKTAPVNLRSEWMWGKDDNMKSNGGYVTAQVNNVGVKNLDMVASYDRLKVGDADAFNRYQAGLQYWFYKMCRVQAAYIYTDVAGLHEHGVLTQVQVGF